jgi:hypothetical protein
MLPNQYQLQLATDYCLAGHFPPAPPGQPPDPPYSPPIPPFPPNMAPTPPPASPPPTPYSPGTTIIPNPVFGSEYEAEAHAPGRNVGKNSGENPYYTGGTSYNAGRRLQQVATTSSAASFACLDSADGRCTRYDQGLTQHLVHQATAGTQMRHMRAVANAWAISPRGQWSRIHLPGNLLAMELFIINTENGPPVNSLEAERPPPFNCTTAACEPLDPGVVVRFRRREHQIRPGMEARDCALIQKSSRNIMESGVMGIRQMPPERAWCAPNHVPNHVPWSATVWP